MNEQLDLFPTDSTPKWKEIEDALVFYMQKCLQLEHKLNEYKIKFGELDEATH